MAIVLGLLTALASPVAGELDERGWCERIAPRYGAEVEVRLWDTTRCDLVTAEEAIEVDWPAKWAESIGQAQYYAILLDKRPAVVLLVRDLDAERRYVYRCQTVCAKLGMRLYVEVLPRSP